MSKLLNGIQLDYVSGAIHSYMKLPNTNKELEEENLQDYKHLLEYLESKLKGYFTTSVLFNAFQEVSQGEQIKSRNGMGNSSIYSDSGGLQVLTKGLEITDELKEEVYNNQAKYSDFAMSFDEMPLISVRDDGQSNFANAKVFIDELIPITAGNSAKHIQQQIKVFQALKSDTKILPIIHGYTAESYIDYAKGLFGNISDNEHIVNGLSIASLSSHFDTKVGIMKIFDVVPKILNDDFFKGKKLDHVHFLGVARPLRILPLLLLAKKGLLPIKRLSFDSTAITKAASFGKAFINLDEIKNPRNFSPAITLNSYKNKNYPNVAQFYQEVHKFMKDYDGYVFDSWEDLAEHSPNNGSKLKCSEQFEKNGIEWERKFLAQTRYITFYNTYAYLSVLEAFIDDEITFKDIIKNNTGILTIFEKFNSVNTLEEFAEIADYFYNMASNGRTDSRTLVCKTIEEFEKKYNTEQPCLLKELGIEKNVEILNEELKKPWIKSSMKRARKDEWSDDNHPGNSLF